MDVIIKAIELSIKQQEHKLKEYIEDGKWSLAATTESYISGLQVALEIVKGYKET